MIKKEKRIDVTKEIYSKVSCTSIVSPAYKTALAKLSPAELLICRDYINENYPNSKIDSTKLLLYIYKTFNGTRIRYTDRKKKTD
jgi:hypothetical protein